MKNRTVKIMDLAIKNIGKGYMVDSAQICLDDANSHIKNDMPIELIHYRALKSIAYSVGILHKDYIRAKKISVLSSSNINKGI